MFVCVVGERRWRTGETDDVMVVVSKVHISDEVLGAMVLTATLWKSHSGAWVF